MILKTVVSGVYKYHHFLNYPIKIVKKLEREPFLCGQSNE